MVQLVARVFSLCAIIWGVIGSPITNPLKSDEDIGQVIPQYFDSKRTKSYHTYTPNTTISAHEVAFSLEHGISTEFSLRWSTTVGSPVYATPVIFPSATDGRKQIFVNTFYQYAEMIDSDGYKSWGWPLSFEDSSFQGSPMVYDVDGDGHIDMGLVDKNGNMFWVRIGQAGEYLEDYHVQVPKLKVKRDWAEGLDPTFVDSYVKLSMFDRSQPGQEGAGGAGRGGAMRTARLDDLQAVAAPAKDAAPQRRRLSEEGDGQQQEQEDHGQEGQEMEQEGRVDMDFGDGATDDFMRLEAERIESGRLMYGVQPEEETAEGLEGSQGEGEGGAASAESAGSGSDPDAPASQEDVMGAGEPDAASAEAAEAQALDGTYEYAYRAAPKRAHGGHRTGYGAGAYYAGGGGEGGLNESQYVMVDPHVLASPVLVDINGDGHMEVLMSVSYYFDKAEYAGSDIDFDPELYVAGGVACWDLDEQRWTWLVHLDLTTTKSKFQAMIYAPPTVADLDGDGRTEVIVGTALGLLYVMDGESGFVRRFFPMQFQSIQAQVSVADVAGDSRLEMIVLDMGGTVAVVDVDGDVLWDAHLSGTLPFPATVGDVDGDGLVDVVVVAATANKGSHIYALRGDTGAVLPGYPITLPGNTAVSSPVLLVDLLSARARGRPRDRGAGNTSFEERIRQIPLRKPALFTGSVDDPFPIDPLDAQLRERLGRAAKEQPKGLHLVVSSHEGSVYLIYGQPTEQLVSLAAEEEAVLAGSEGKAAGGKTAAGPARFHAQRLDVGEHIYSAPLLDDVTGDGYLDLLVGTLNGQLLLFESSLPHHPGNSWTSFPNHRLNSVTHGVMGVAVPFAEKQKLRQYDIKGRSTLNVVFEIWDKNYVERPVANAEALAEPAEEGDGRYTVSITRGANKLQSVWKQSFSKPGRYVASIPVSPPELTLLVVSMRSAHGEYFEDTVHVALSTRFYIWIKYLICAPIALLSFTLVGRFRKHIV